MEIRQRTRVGWRERVTYVMGILGNSDRRRCHGGDADGLYGLSLFRWDTGSAGIRTSF